MADLKIVVNAVDNATGVLRGIGGVTTGIFQGIGQAAVGALGNAVGGAFEAIRSSMIDGNAEFERYQTQFGVLLGNADDAKKRLEELAEFGAKTPFELPEVVRADKILQAFGLHAEDVAARFGFSGEEIRTIAGDTAAGTGASFEEIAGYLGKFSSGATGEAIARMQELGITTRAELKEMGLEFSKSGELLTPVDEAMDVLLAAMKDKFGGMMDAQSSTFEGMMSNLQDWFGAAGRTIGAPLFDVAKNGLGRLLEMLNGFMPTLQNLSQALGASLGILLEGDLGGAIDALGEFESVQAIFSKLGIDIYGVSGAFENLMTLFAPIGASAGQLAQAFAASLPMIQTYVADMVTFVQGQFAQFAPEIVANVSTALTQIAAFWTAHGDEIMAVVNFVFRTITTVIGGAMTLISGLIAMTLQLINGDWQGAWDTAKATLDTFLQGALNIVGVSLESFLATWEGVFTNLQLIIQAGLTLAAQAISDKINEFVAMGQNIVKGIADGITAGIQWVIDAATAAAQAAAAAVAGALDLHSPSRVFMDIGKNTMAGFAQGVDKYAYMPANAAAQAAYSTTVSVGAINVNGAGNPSTVAAALRRELDALAARADNRVRI